MDSGSVFTRILADHDRLRCRFDSVEHVAMDIVEGFGNDINLLIRTGESSMSELFEPAGRKSRRGDAERSDPVTFTGTKRIAWESRRYT